MQSEDHPHLQFFLNYVYARYFFDKGVTRSKLRVIAVGSRHASGVCVCIS